MVQKQTNEAPIHMAIQTSTMRIMMLDSVNTHLSHLNDSK